MFPSNLAAASASYVLLCLILVQYSTAISPPRLGGEVSSFIPNCARQCFLSFLDVNYDIDRCGVTPSLRCLCSSRGTLDFTVGEGAVQCIFAEKSVGGCSDSEADDQVSEAAYEMCKGVSGALEPTHDVITAIVVFPTESGQPVRFPPLTRTTSSSFTSTSKTASILPTTLVTDTSRPPTPTNDPFPSPTSKSSESPSATQEPTLVSSTSAVSSATATPGVPPVDENGEGEKDNEEDDKDLTTAQVAGISVGAAAAAAVAIGAIILARHCRRRRNPGIRTGFLPTRETWGYKPDAPNPGSRSTSWIVGQMRPSPNPEPMPPPPAYQNANRKPDMAAIGLALSPPFRRDPATRTPARPLSRLLPAKPILPPLFVNKSPPLSDQIRLQGEGDQQDAPPRPQWNLPPQQAAVTQLQPPAIIPQASPPRSSKDGPPLPIALKLKIPTTRDLTAPPPVRTNARDSSATEFEEDGSSSLVSPMNALVWRPPSAVPGSAHPCYVADKNGNWVLTEVENGSNPLAADVVTPISPPELGAANPVSIFAVVNSNDTSSHVVSKVQNPAPSLGPAANIPRDNATNAYHQPFNAPKPLFSGPRLQQGPAPRRPLMRTTSSSESDVTPIDTSSSGPTPPEPLGSLSPVMESPAQESRAAGGIAATSAGLGIRPARNIIPPPARAIVYYPPGQPSPTLGMMQAQQPPGPGMASQNVPTKNRRPAENPALVRTGSPTIRAVEPSPEPEDSMNQRPVAPPRDPRRQSQVRPKDGRDYLPSSLGNGRQPHPQSMSQPYPLFHQFPPGPYPQHRQSRQHPPSQNQQYHPPNRPGPQRYPEFHPSNQQNQTQQQRPHPARQPPYPLNHHDYPPSPGQASHFHNIHPALRPMAPLQTQQYRGPPRRFSQDHHHPQPPPPLKDFQSPISDLSASSVASSLLAKRLGNDRAAAMNIPTSQGSGTWRRDGMLSPDPYNGAGWVPRLTPTRRGNDLFLNVDV